MEQPSSKALFTPAKTQRASEAIYNQIYPKIISGELRPGDRLPPERELAEMFQRSRPVVREALRMLQQEGLIETAVGTPVEMADLNDAKHCADLLLAFVCRKLEPIK